MVDQDSPQQSRAELESGVLGFTFGFGGEPRLKLLIQHRDLLNRGFLCRNAGHLKFQPPDILRRPGGDGLGELEITLPGKYIGDDVWSVKGNPLGVSKPTRGEVDANDANVFANEWFTTERAGGGETRRSLGNDLFATT
jgi:hypothetical protein